MWCLQMLSLLLLANVDYSAATQCEIVPVPTGALVVAAGETRTLTTDQEGFSYTSVDVAVGGTLLAVGAHPLIIHSRGAVLIDGLVNVSGTRGGNSAGNHMAAGGGAGGGALKISAPSITVSSTGVIQADGGWGGDGGGYGQSFFSDSRRAGNGDGGVGVAGGGNGGHGGTSNGNGFPGVGPGASGGGATHGGVPPGPGGAGYAFAGMNGFASYSHNIMNGGPAYGDAMLSGGLLGGSGAGGGGNDGDNEEGAGGGGSGGTIYLIANSLEIAGTVSAAGGLGGLDDYHWHPGQPRQCCNNGGEGSVGRIRLDYTTYTSSGASITPAPGYALDYSVTGGQMCVGASGDPHLALPHGGKADFRGEHKQIYNFLSAKGLSLNVMTELADFELHPADSARHKDVHGSFLTQAHVVARTSTGKTVRVSFWAEAMGKKNIGSCNGTVDSEPAFFMQKMIKSDKQVDDVSLRMSYSSLHVTTPEFEIVVIPHQFRLERNVAGLHHRLDVQIKPRVAEAALAVPPHGIVGQGWDGDGKAIDGEQDSFPVSGEFTTYAMARGAIEGSPSDYKVATKYATDFKYSRFDATSAEPRNVAKLVAAGLLNAPKSVYGGETVGSTEITEENM